MAILALGLALVAGGVTLPARADPAASRVVDRTVSCPIGKRAGVRKVEVHARSGTRLYGDPTKWKYLASASVYDPSAYPAFGYAVAGWPPALEPGQESSKRALAVGVRCTSVSTRVPLTTKGLSGFAASPLDDEYHCVVPRRVLVRIKATFRGPTTLRLDRKSGQLIAHGIVREAVLTARTETGRPVFLASVNENGKARLYVGDNCEPDLISSDG